MDGSFGETGEDRGPSIHARGCSSVGRFRTTERMAATLGSGLLAADVIQFLRPSATGRMEFSARLFAELKFRVFQEAREFRPKRQRVVRGFGQSAGGQ